MMVVSPADAHEMRDVILSLANHDGPAYIRVGKGGEPDVTSHLSPNSIGKIRQVFDGQRVAVLTTGSLLQECITACKMLEAGGVSTGLYHVPYIAPLDKSVINQLVDKYEFLVVVEEHLPHGGLSTAIAEIMASVNCKARLRSLSLPNRYASKYGSQREHQVVSKLTSDGIVESIHEYFSN
jgi:transketolase